jgi:hypothetical protein
MGWWEDMQAAVTPAATLTTLVIRFSEAFHGPKPTLGLTLGDGVDQNERELIFTAFLSETANRVPAMRVHVFAEIEGEGLVFEADPFNLAAGELDYDVPVTLRRPEHGTKVPECNHAVTLYGRKLHVSAATENGGAVSVEWVEDAYEPGSARYDAMQAAWRAAGH